MSSMITEDFAIFHCHVGSIVLCKFDICHQYKDQNRVQRCELPECGPSRRNLTTERLHLSSKFWAKAARGFNDINFGYWEGCFLLIKLS